MQNLGRILSFLLICLCASLPAEELPGRLQVALMSKIFAMESGTASKQNLTIYVLDAPEIALLLKSEIGFHMGSATLTRVEAGKDIPTEAFDVIYIGSISLQDDAAQYAKQHHALSLYPIINGMQAKGSLGLGIKSGKPTFLLNLQQSEYEGLNWHSTIVKLASVVP